MGRILALGILIGGLLCVAHGYADEEVSADDRLYMAAEAARRGDTPTQLAILRKLAEEGNISAVTGLAGLYYRGIDTRFGRKEGLKRNPERAVQLLQNIDDNPHGQFVLAQILYQPKGSNTLRFCLQSRMPLIYWLTYFEWEKVKHVYPSYGW